MKVALVVMPFAAADRPSLGVGLLQAGLRRIGIPCDVKYFNLTFSKMLGHDAYHGLCRNAVVPLAGEWIFSQVFYGDGISDWETYEREVLDQEVWGMPKEDREHVRRARDEARVLLRLAFESTRWEQYDLVGFTSTFAQTTSSLCLARMLREHHPGITLVFGGANFEGDMGKPYLDRFGEFIDFISTGEADTSFPALCRNLDDFSEGRAERLRIPPGFLYSRRFDAVAEPGEAPPIKMDELPTPDYRDYYRAVDRIREAGDREPLPLAWMPIETSRGCWWGQKSHCTFCGLNGRTLAFRRKSWRRVVEEIEELHGRHGEIPLQFTDNILGMDYFRNLLPHWAREDDPVPKFFEIKANLRRSQVQLLRRAGIVRVQPGVESLLDTTLKEMQKGITGAQNIAFLRWCVEEGIHPSWNILYGFPGEHIEEFAHQLELLRKMVHFTAPQGAGPIHLDRFSPNHTRWRELGFTAIEPSLVYRHIFPFSEEVLNELAYYFDYRHPQQEEALEAGLAIDRWISRWQELRDESRQGELAVRPHWRGGFVLVDSRHGFPRRADQLDPVDLALLVACDAPVSRDRAVQRVADTLNGDSGGAPRIARVLDRLLERAVIVETSSRIITLALLPSQESLHADPEWMRFAAGSLSRADEADRPA